MSTIMPKGKKVQDALKWISGQDRSQKDLKKLVQEASFQFNLNPKEEDYLRRLFLNGEEQTDS
jgi:hypothetical protein